jgi:hypothetical protein
MEIGYVTLFGLHWNKVDNMACFFQFMYDTYTIPGSAQNQLV